MSWVRIPLGTLKSLGEIRGFFRIRISAFSYKKEKILKEKEKCDETGRSPRCFSLMFEYL